MLLRCKDVRVLPPIKRLPDRTWLVQPWESAAPALHCAFGAGFAFGPAVSRESMTATIDTMNRKIR